MDPTKERPRSAQVPGFHRVLPLLHPRILTDRPTPTRPHQTSDTVALGRQRAGSIRGAPRQDGQQTGPTAARLRQNLLPPNRRVEVQGGGGPVTGRRDKGGDTTKATPSRVLLSHLHPHGTKLRRSRSRVPGGLQINQALEALPDL